MAQIFFFLIHPNSHISRIDFSIDKQKIDFLPVSIYPKYTTDRVLILISYKVDLRKIGHASII